MKKLTLFLLCLSLFSSLPVAAQGDPFDKNILTELKNAGVNPSQVLKKGQTAPSISLINAQGKKVLLAALLKKGPVVLTFYRGNWCPYCNQAMQKLKEAHPQFKSMGATIVAVSPQTQGNTQVMQRKYNLPFEVLSDPNNQVARRYGLVYKVPKAYLKKLKSFFIEIKNYNGNTQDELPLTATYVINQKGKVAFAYVSPDYKKRAKPSTLLKVLKGL